MVILSCGAANLVSGERRERFGNRRVSLKGIAKGEGERRADADKRKMATGQGEREKNVQEKKKERGYDEGNEDIEHVWEIPTCFRGDLRSS